MNTQTTNLVNLPQDGKPKFRYVMALLSDSYFYHRITPDTVITAIKESEPVTYADFSLGVSRINNYLTLSYLNFRFIEYTKIVAALFERYAELVHLNGFLDEGSTASVQAECAVQLFLVLSQYISNFAGSKTNRHTVPYLEVLIEKALSISNAGDSAPFYEAVLTKEVYDDSMLRLNLMLANQATSEKLPTAAKLQQLIDEDAPSLVHYVNHLAKFNLEESRILYLYKEKSTYFTGSAYHFYTGNVLANTQMTGLNITQLLLPNSLHPDYPFFPFASKTIDDYVQELIQYIPQNTPTRFYAALLEYALVKQAKSLRKQGKYKNLEQSDTAFLDTYDYITSDASSFLASALIHAPKPLFCTDKESLDKLIAPGVTLFDFLTTLHAFKSLVTNIEENVTSIETKLDTTTLFTTESLYTCKLVFLYFMKDNSGYYNLFLEDFTFDEFLQHYPKAVNARSESPSESFRQSTQFYVDYLTHQISSKRTRFFDYLKLNTYECEQQLAYENDLLLRVLFANDETIHAFDDYVEGALRQIENTEEFADFSDSEKSLKRMQRLLHTFKAYKKDDYVVFLYLCAKYDYALFQTYASLLMEKSGLQEVPTSADLFTYIGNLPFQPKMALANVLTDYYTE